MEVSSNDASTRWPRPVTCRCNSALTAPNAPNTPVARSRNDTPHRTGAPPGSPVIDMTPLNACMTASYPPLSARGPVRPNAEIEQ